MAVGSKMMRTKPLESIILWHSSYQTVYRIREYHVADEAEEE